MLSFASITAARRDALCQALNAIGWPTQTPQATMFVWTKIPDFYRGEDSLSFVKRVLSGADVVVSAGSTFGPCGEGYVRFSLIESPERTREAVQRIGAMFQRDGAVA